MTVSVQQTSGVGEQAGLASLDDLAAFRCTFYDCLTLRADALFELTDAVLCTEGPVNTLVGLTLTAEHRRGHGALYDAPEQRPDPGGTVAQVAGRPAGAARRAGADHAGAWTSARGCARMRRPGADRSFCHVYGRGKGQAQMIPGWPYSFVAALEPGRTSWTTLPDAVRLGPCDDATTVTATPLRG